MKTSAILSLLAVASVAIGGCQPASVANEETKRAFNEQTAESAKDKVVKTDDEWKKILTPQQFEILRRKGTERAGTGELLNVKDKGTFLCAGCGNELFSSETKFESGTGWPSFYQPIAKGKVTVALDNSHGMTRDEVICTRCDGHLGHVFNDGPPPTGLRYCMNSVAMKFVKAK
jgi:peptide-methionine (R)-S-oxide reductase